MALKREPTSYLYVNKKHTKVKMRGTPKAMGLLGFATQWSFPFAYLSYRYGLFTFREEGYAITGWGIVGLIIALLIFRDKIKDTFKEAEANLGETYKRSKLAITMVILSIIVVLTNYFVEAFVVLFLVIGGSTLSSLPFYKVHDTVLTVQKEMQAELKKRNTEKAMNSIDTVLQK